MKFILSAHNVKITQALEDQIINRIEKIEHFDSNAVDVRVTIEHDHTKASDRSFSCSMRLSVPGPDLFAEDSESSLETAIDLVAKKIEQQIRKRHTKLKERRRSKASESKRRRQEAAI